MTDRRIICDECRCSKGLFLPRCFEGGPHTTAQIYVMCRETGRTWVKPAREALMKENAYRVCPGFKEL